MKLISSTINATLFNIVILATRIAVSVMMLTHGFPKLMKFFNDEPLSFADPLGIGEVPTLLLAVFAEVVCSFLIIMGLVTRYAVIPLALTMIVAIFIQHGDDPFAKQEKAYLYLVIYLILLVTGGGRYSADNLILKK